MFFEQQLGELVEDFGLGGKGKKYWETNQEPGDLLYVPSSLVRVCTFSTAFNSGNFPVVCFEEILILLISR